MLKQMSIHQWSIWQKSKPYQKMLNSQSTFLNRPFNQRTTWDDLILDLPSGMRAMYKESLKAAAHFTYWSTPAAFWASVVGGSPFKRTIVEHNLWNANFITERIFQMADSKDYAHVPDPQNSVALMEDRIFSGTSPLIGNTRLSNADLTSNMSGKNLYRAYVKRMLMYFMGVLAYIAIKDREVARYEDAYADYTDALNNWEGSLHVSAQDIFIQQMCEVYTALQPALENASLSLASFQDEPTSIVYKNSALFIYNQYQTLLGLHSSLFGVNQPNIVISGYLERLEQVVKKHPDIFEGLKS